MADDEPKNLQIIVDALKDSDIQHKIIRAVNGKVLCELAEKRLPDLIITDWEMPEMNGIEAVKYLKNIESTKDIPVIMCTGIMTTSENLKMALDSGAVDYIRKPIDEIELQARVFSMLKLGDSYRTIKDQNDTLEQRKKEIQIQSENLVEINNLLLERNIEINDQNIEIQSQAKELEKANIELEKLSIVASKTDNAVIIMDESFNFEWVNEGFTKLYGYTLDDLILSGKGNLMKGSDYENIAEKANLCIETKESIHYEITSNTVDKRKIWVQTTLTPIIDNSGKIKKIIAIDSDITGIKQAEIEIKKQNKEIQKQRDELEIANATKDKFFGIIAHDLRNPFSNIIGFSDLLMKQITKKDLEKSYRSAEMIHQSSSVAYDLLESLLDWSRSQKDIITFLPESLDMKTLIDANILLMKGLAETKGIRLASLLTEDFVVFADKNMILAILRNLVTNAIKFSRKDDQITISVEELSDSFAIHVTDTGIGIKADVIPKLFKIGENVKTSGTSNEPGTGLGLILCQEFINWHGGKIWAESESGVGSRFSFALPKSKQ